MPYYPRTNILTCFIQESAVDETSSDWTVTTDKNLSFSNLFLFNLFYEGETSPVAVSETFNITGDSSSSTTTSSASTTSSATAISTNFLTSTISVAATSHTGSATSSTTTAAAASTTGTVSSQSGGLSTGTKIGVGIAVPAVAFIGIAVGYFLFRHRAKKQQYAATPHAAEQSPGPMEQKPDDLTVGYTHERPAYELYSVSGSPMPMNQRPAYPTAGYTPERPTYELDNMSGPMTRYELGSDTGRH
ncbi:hypothetical protein N0V82_003356 [Gnomoniopsis sp. IMI 355080]|nr:hypothetical protein N0V82_003356 [Gnomoniopsis sp. IMI 355080]